MKQKEYIADDATPEKMTIAPGSGPSTDVATPVAPPAQQNPPDRNT